MPFMQSLLPFSRFGLCHPALRAGPMVYVLSCPAQGRFFLCSLKAARDLAHLLRAENLVYVDRDDEFPVQLANSCNEALNGHPHHWRGRVKLVGWYPYNLTGRV